MPSATHAVRGGHANAHWEAVAAVPCPALTGLVHGYAGFRERSTAAVQRRELPSAEVVLVVNLEAGLTVSRGPGRVAAPAAFVTGVGHSSVTTSHAGWHAALEVRIPAPAAKAVLGAPGIALAEQVVDLGDLWGTAAAELVEQLTGQNWDRCFRVLESVLLARAARAGPADLHPPLVYAHDLLLAHEGDLPMRDLLEATGWSRRRLAGQFNEHAGMTPKALARLVRFRHAERLLRAPGHRSVASIALTCGYCDQAHLNRDFRELAGCSPTAYLVQLRGDTSGTGMATAHDSDHETQTYKTEDPSRS